MNVAAVDLVLAPALEALGHTVRTISPPAGVARLADHLDGFQPDLIVQQERLGPRVLLADLPDFPCPKVFWSIDTHLNAYWHQDYGQLFDATLTTQPAWVPRLRRHLPAVDWLPWPGTPRPLAPWEGRTTPVLFVGRLGPTRPVRIWFVDLLHRLPGFRLETDLLPEAMLAAYDHAHIAPNEAILGEINFRLLEAASCGCAVITPDVPGVADLFTPGEEVLLYDHGGQMLEMVRDLLAHPVKARLLGTRAYARVQAAHLPTHRARRLLELVPDPGAAAHGRAAEAAFWSTIAVLREAGHLDVPPERLRPRLAALTDHPAAAAALLRLEVATDPEAARALVEALAQTPPADQTLLAQAGLAALRLGAWEAAKQLHAAAGIPLPEPPALSPAVLLAWATRWEQAGLPCRPGFVFDPSRHLPGSALEALVLAHEQAPEAQEPPRRLAELLAPWRGYEATRLGALSFLSLRHPEDWRLGLDAAHTNARAFRLREAAEELALAQAQASRQGEAAAFRQALDALDPSGALARILAAAGAGLAENL